MSLSLRLAVDTGSTGLLLMRYVAAVVEIACDFQPKGRGRRACLWQGGRGLWKTPLGRFPWEGPAFPWAIRARAMAAGGIRAPCSVGN